MKENLTFENNGVVYKTISDMEVQVKDLSGMGWFTTRHIQTDWNIPATVRHNGMNYTVIGIGNCGFYQRFRLRTLVLPESLTSIGNRAFSNCENLTSITLPESLTSIGALSFIGCESLIEIICNMKKEPLIGIGAFYGISKRCVLVLNQNMKANPELWNVGKVINGKDL